MSGSACGSLVKEAAKNNLKLWLFVYLYLAVLLGKNVHVDLAWQPALSKIYIKYWHYTAIYNAEVRLFKSSSARFLGWGSTGVRFRIEKICESQLEKPSPAFTVEWRQEWRYGSMSFGDTGTMSTSAMFVSDLQKTQSKLNIRWMPNVFETDGNYGVRVFECATILGCTRLDFVL